MPITIRQSDGNYEYQRLITRQSDGNYEWLRAVTRQTDGLYEWDLGGGAYVLYRRNNMLRIWNLNLNDLSDTSGLIGTVPNRSIRAFAVKDNFLYGVIEERFVNQLYKYSLTDLSGGHVGQLLATGGIAANGLTFIGNDLLVACYDNNNTYVYRVNPNNPSDTSGVYGSKGRMRPTGRSEITVTPNGNVYMFRQNTRNIYRINPDSVGSTTSPYGIVGTVPRLPPQSYFDTVLESLPDGDLVLLASDTPQRPNYGLYRINPANPADTSGNYGLIDNFSGFETNNIPTAVVIAQ